MLYNNVPVSGFTKIKWTKIKDFRKYVFEKLETYLRIKSNLTIKSYSRSTTEGLEILLSQSTNTLIFDLV